MSCGIGVDLSGFYSASLISVFIFPQMHGLDHCRFVTDLELWWCEFPKFDIVFNTALVILDPLPFYRALRV